MLLEIVPDPGCVAVLDRAGVNYDNASHELAAAAKALGVPLLPITVADVNDLPTRIAEIAKRQCRVLVAMSEPLFVRKVGSSSNWRANTASPQATTIG
jgi:hypothetical protein